MMYLLVHNAKKQGLSDQDIAQLVNLDPVSVKRILNYEARAGIIQWLTPH
jgi:hypothetical protein